ncbi:non-ribosomal peptide synthetase [Krasilnikovia sp. M28-CT-15]|uniref:non-ribosomal peptide synthetase n=1 Tax=Krasilnikovia sp. M28-CT-15 TaxID=3373540 RepID=UPI003876E349
MEPTHTSTLPLARPGGPRTGAVHHRPLEVPGAAVWRRREYAEAALAVLIHRYTGETDLVVAGDGDIAWPIRVTGETTACGLLVAIGSAPLDAHDPRPATGAVLSAVPGDAPPAPLTVVVTRDGGELLISADEFDDDAADQYARHLSRILRALATDPTIAVRDIALLTDEERHRILVDWNQTDAPVPPAFFHEVIAEIAARTPDAVAVTWPGGSLTFGELDRRANRLAHRLSRLGVRPHSRVATCFPRSAESLVAQLACFKLAAAAVLLDPDFPVDRLRYMIEDAESVAVLTMAAHEPKLYGICPVVPLDTSDWHTEPDDPVSEPVTADHLIHVCYTSGSTGRPKAVLVRHGAARNLIYSMRTVLGITAESRGTWLAAPGYGMVEVECFSVLAAGAPVQIPEPSVVTSPVWLRDWLVAERITHTLLMKAMAERLWELDWPADTALRNIRICGERVQSWPSGLPFHVFNLYGSAEATVVATCDITELGRQLGQRGRARELPPIGRPLHNVKTYVLDERQQPVPPGVVGEICVAGDSLSEGYLNQPEATALKWLPNPIDPARHPILYRTGDLARYWPDGNIEIVGRTDNQVKVRGNRVHLGEIEVALAAQPGVHQAAVLAKKDETGDTRLVAYLEPESGVAPSVRQIRSALRDRLPSFMIPVAYVVGTFPTTTNGKIDRNALPEPPKSRPDVGSAYQEPRNPIEQRLRQLWTTTLDLEGIGVLDNFFELGGDSIRAAALTAQIQEFFRVETTVDDLFDDPSIERMALAVGAALRA